MWHLVKFADDEGNIECVDIASKSITSISDMIHVPLCNYHYNRLEEKLNDR